MAQRVHIGVIGAGDCSPELYALAHELGRYIGQKKWVLFCGGLGGIMQGVADGCSHEGAMTVGLLPGNNKESANPFITLPIPTGLGEGRNLLLVRASDVVIAISGGYGTLSEIGLALKIGKPVVGLKTWSGIDGIEYVETAEQAIGAAEKHLADLKRKP
jgi:uncharacterized protein (TIGR00725 family)